MQAQAQWSKPSQWNNTPAAPAIMNEPDVSVSEKTFLEFNK